MGSTRYIMSMGELTRKDNSLCFRKDGKNVYIPIENTKEIYCMNEVTVNTKLLDFLSQNPPAFRTIPFVFKTYK